MKNTTSLKNILGLSQKEMAMLLGITVSQWSMCKSGKRDIPLAAKQQLAILVSNTQKTKSVSKETQKITEAEKMKEKVWVKREYKTLQHKQQLLERKINVMENSRLECFAALEVVHYLESQPEKEPIASLAKSIKIRATNTINKNSLYRLQKMQLKKESHEMLKNILEQKMNTNLNEL